MCTHTHTQCFPGLDVEDSLGDYRELQGEGQP